MSTINKSELARRLASRIGTSKARAEEMVEETLTEIGSALTQGHDVTLHGFGLRQLTDSAGTGMLDADKLDGAIARAGEDIDGALADAGFATPITGWSRARVHAEALARWYLGGRTEAVQSDYEAAQVWLQRISEGRLRPPQATATPTLDPPADSTPQHSTGEVTWDPDTLDDFAGGSTGW